MPSDHDTTISSNVMGGSFAILLPFLISLSACQSETQIPASPKPVLAMTITADDAKSERTYSGEIVPRYRSDLAFRTAGRIAEKYVEIGTHVKAGQRLASLDTRDLALDVSVATSRAEAARAAAGERSANLARMTRLAEEGFISQAELELHRSEARQAQSQLRANNALSAASSRQLGHAVLRAGRGGVVASVSAEVGEVVATGQPVVSVVSADQAEVAISIPETEVAAFRESQIVDIVTPAIPGRKFSGRLRVLAPAADATTRTFDARIALVASEPDLPMGATAEVRTSGKNAAGKGYRLPSGAVSRHKGKTVVWLIHPRTAEVHPQAISITGSSENFLTVTGKIRSGDRIVTAGTQLLHPGQHVKPLSSGPGNR